MSPPWSAFLAIVGKDLRTELRTREVLATTIVFPLLILFVFRVSFEVGDEAAMRSAAPGVVWASALFASILSLTRSFSSEKEDDRILGLLLSPVDRGTIYLAKLCGNVAFLLLVESISLVAFGFFFNVDLLPGLPVLVPVVVLGTLGISAVGTVFSAMAVNTRAREALLPLLLFPVLTPVLLAVLEHTRRALSGQGTEGAAHWLGMLVAFDVIFTAAGWMLFEYVVTD